MYFDYLSEKINFSTQSSIKFIGKLSSKSITQYPHIFYILLNIPRNVSVTDGEALLIFDFYFLGKGQCCVFWEESLVHTQLSFHGLINLKDSYCGRVSDSGITAQTQYLTPNRACTLHILAHPLSRSFCSGHGKYRLIQVWNCRKKKKLLLSCN